MFGQIHFKPPSSSLSLQVFFAQEDLGPGAVAIGTATFRGAVQKTARNRCFSAGQIRLEGSKIDIMNHESCQEPTSGRNRSRRYFLNLFKDLPFSTSPLRVDQISSLGYG